MTVVIAAACGLKPNSSYPRPPGEATCVANLRNAKPNCHFCETAVGVNLIRKLSCCLGLGQRLGLPTCQVVPWVLGLLAVIRGAGRRESGNWHWRGDDSETMAMKAVHNSGMLIAVTALILLISSSQTACRTPAPTGPRGAVSQDAMKVLSALDGHALYVAHCAACHGSTGLGDGPAAIALTVAPRNFWHDRFRYVSALNGVPTDDDLIDTIRNGRRFGEMPAGPQLTDAEVDALVAYVREIQRLGWLDDLQAEFADDDDTSPDEIEEISEARVTPREVIRVARRPSPAFRLDASAGRELYAANCASCHGLSGRGDGMDKPLDEQGKPISVRDLTSGMFRGGTTVEEIFKRIRCGVPGTPMSAAVAPSDEEIWQLVYYVRFLAGQR